MRVIQSLVILVTICITLLILVGLAQISHLQTNTLLIREQKRSKSATSQITQWVIIPREQMEDVRRELFTRRQRVMQICEIIGLKKSNLDTVLTNVIIDKYVEKYFLSFSYLLHRLYQRKKKQEIKNKFNLKET